jgi:hypothetical protein
VFKERLALAEILGDTPSKQGTTILIAMLNDEEMRVRVQAIKSLGNSKEISALIELIKRYKAPNKKIRDAVDAAVENIAVPAGPQSIDKLKEIAFNPGSRVQSRLCAVDFLGKTRDESPVGILSQLLDDKNEMIRYWTALAIQELISSHSLSDASKDRLLKKLKKCLTEIDTRKMEWRRIRDENTERYDDTQMKAWQKKLEEKKPEARLEYEIAYTIALIDPKSEGINLLGHNLVRVQAAAWTGLGESHDIALMEEIYKKRRESDFPWLKDAAYRAIDKMLENIEEIGDKKECAPLEALYNKLVKRDGKNMHPGIKSRMKWTIDRLKERIQR